MDSPSKPKSIRPTLRLWHALSSAFASLGVHAALLLLGFWLVTGNPLIADDTALTESSTEVAVQWLFGLTACIGLAAFLSTYLLDSVVRGCIGSAFLLLLTCKSFLIISLVFPSIAVGAIAGSYFEYLF